MNRKSFISIFVFAYAQIAQAQPKEVICRHYFDAKLREKYTVQVVRLTPKDGKYLMTFQLEMPDGEKGRPSGQVYMDCSFMHGLGHCSGGKHKNWLRIEQNSVTTLPSINATAPVKSEWTTLRASIYDLEDERLGNVDPGGAPLYTELEKKKFECENLSP